MELPEPVDHDSFLAIAGVGVGYGLVLLAIFAVLFLVPLAVFTLL